MAATSDLCLCLTKAGTQCKNTAVPGDIFCRVRRRQEGAKSVGMIAPKKAAPSSPRRSISPPSPSRRAAQQADIAYFDQLDNTTIENICDQLTRSNDYVSLARLITSGKRFRTLCQASLDKLEDAPSEIVNEDDLVWPAGTMLWKDKAGRLHRGKDEPAVIAPDRTQEWYQHGELHREGDKPAYVGPDAQVWWFNGKMHREGDQPAIIWSDGEQEWWFNGQKHREGDQPAFIGADQSRWYQHDTLHREGGRPAIIRADGTQEWWVNGRRVR